MFPAAFDYHAPDTLNDALSLLRQHREDAKLLAGGHSLIPLMKLRLATPAVVIDLGRIDALKGIRVDGNEVIIGALTTHHAIEASPIAHTSVPILADTAAAIGDIQVRNRGTIGGSVAHADPAADWPATLLALDASFVIESTAGRRVVPAGQFFQGLMTTAVESGDILSEVRIPIPSEGLHAYEKVRQPASGFALVGIAIQLAMHGDVCRRAAIGLTGIAPQPSRATAAEAELAGQRLDDAVIVRAADHVADGLDPLDDLHASSEFRAHLARVHARRALKRLAGLRHA
jgi:carbon-monoxide dehydrogenase medium subunit